jgi:hypothetical protein
MPENIEAKKQNKEPVNSMTRQEKDVCGLIMPISSVDDCSNEHWKNVKDIISRAVDKAGLRSRMVNESEEVAIIHRNIVNNIYTDPIVVCDVSHRNPNVMLELGMRLAFGKHVVIIKDDLTNMPFDAGVIEFIQYPRALHFPDIEKFILALSEKIKKTYDAAKRGDKSTFLEYFGEVKSQNLEGSELSLSDYLAREFMALHARINKIAQQNEPSPMPTRALPFPILKNKYENFCVKKGISKDLSDSIDKFASEYLISENQRIFLKTQYEYDDVPF